ncbi:MAG: hypothetical protein ACO24P_02110 [Candidatus Nanopelagicaceae bacterium]
MSPFFVVMHLPTLPTIFVKDGEERKAYYTVEARELLAAGWTEKIGAKPTPRAEVKAETKAAPKTAPKSEFKSVETAKEVTVKASKEEEVK